MQRFEQMIAKNLILEFNTGRVPHGCAHRITLMNLSPSRNRYQTNLQLALGIRLRPSTEIYLRTTPNRVCLCSMMCFDVNNDNNVLQT